LKSRRFNRTFEHPAETIPAVLTAECELVFDE